MIDISGGSTGQMDRRHRAIDRQNIMEQSMNERPRSVEKASGDALMDDVLDDQTEAETQTRIADIIASIRARSAPEGPSSSDAQNAESPRPFARSSDSQAAEIVEKPSLKRSHSSVYPTVLLHSGLPASVLNAQKTSENDGRDYYTTLLHNPCRATQRADAVGEPSYF